MQAQLTRCRNFCWCEGTGVKPDLRAANKTTTQLSGGRGRRDQNRSGRVVDADSEHRPRPPDSCSLGFVSRSTCCGKSMCLAATSRDGCLASERGSSGLRRFAAARLNPEGASPPPWKPPEDPWTLARTPTSFTPPPSFRFDVVGMSPSLAMARLPLAIRS
ncbi:hypothetical protein EYC55_19815 [Xanthomonas oryzae]|nr:hypothetical protein EYC55_19815 [Xanthomonas oryzae]